MLNVNVTMDDWLPDVHEHEHWHHWEDKSNPISCETNVKLTISLERGKWMPPSMVGRFSCESNLLFSKTLDVLVDSAFDLWFNFHSLDHLNNLLLLLIDRAVSSTDLGKTLIDIVVIA